jgi:hypothetical protein
VAARGDTSGRELQNQVGGLQEWMFGVRWGSVGPRAAVGGARAAQVANGPFDVSDLYGVLISCFVKERGKKRLDLKSLNEQTKAEEVGAPFLDLLSRICLGSKHWSHYLSESPTMWGGDPEPTRKFQLSRALHFSNTVLSTSWEFLLYYAVLCKILSGLYTLIHIPPCKTRHICTVCTLYGGHSLQSGRYLQHSSRDVAERGSLSGDRGGGTVSRNVHTCCLRKWDVVIGRPLKIVASSL